MRTVLIVLFVSAYTISSAQTKKTAVDKASADRGKSVYETYCLACHQADGGGVPNLNPPLIKTKWITGDKKELIAVILKGMDQEIEVDGDVYNNIMPPMSHLSDQEIADVLTYVRSNFSNQASVIAESEVKAERSKL